MDLAFWDTSALIPLWIPDQAPRHLNQLAYRYKPVVWWGTTVEAHSVFARQLRAGSMTEDEHAGALANLAVWKRKWQEVAPSLALRTVAEELLGRYPLKAADALQLAAAYIWSDQRPFSRTFICGDKRLLGIARSVGFHGLAID